MRILGIETSCDETAVAIVENFSIAKNEQRVFAVSSAIKTSRDSHVRTGGIVPEVAARRQIESIIPATRLALSTLTKDQIDAIAVTYGPGLIGSLLVGVETAKTLSLIWQKPIVPVNHLVAHIYANFVYQKGGPECRIPKFPAVALVVSGGHTDFVLLKSHGNIKYLGGTRDDAAGEAFDKTARLLGLPYPGGPAIAKAAEKYLGEKLNLFPRPMISEHTIDTSFSGLKTSVLNYTKNNKSFDINHLAAEIQEAIVDTLVAKSTLAVEKYKPKSFLLAGGVSANKRLREKTKAALQDKAKVFVPNPKYSTDNAVMIAAAAYYNYKPVPWHKISANPSLSIEE